MHETGSGFVNNRPHNQFSQEAMGLLFGEIKRTKIFCLASVISTTNTVTVHIQ